MEDKLYATVGWTVGDVMSLTEVENIEEGGWEPQITEEQAEQFLLNNEGHIRDRLIESGWTVLETLMQMDGLL